MIQIITDSARDITLDEAKEYGIHIVPLTITFEDGECPQETREDIRTFFDRLETCNELPVTSQPSPELYAELYEKAREAGDDVLVLALSGGLSGTVNAARIAKDIVDYDRVEVIDTHQAITAQRMVVEYALKLRDEGRSLEEIATAVLEIRDKITVSGVVDTLKFLRKGGRIPASLAILGSALSIKPVIALQDTKLVTIGKAMGRQAGVRMLYQRFEKYEPDERFPIFFGYTQDEDAGREFMEQTIEKYNLQNFRNYLYPVGGVIGTHVGNKCLALCYVAKEEVTSKNSEE